ncbi:MAG: lycopene cyclase domain-containing protein [Bacteroidia bacterium]|nr:lycopene cyclase domain-containing protein [Bacteroidia bacterium]
MPTKFTYLLIDLGSLLVPFIFSFHPKLLFNKNWSAFFKANIIVAVIFILWDALFTRIGVWGFNPAYVCGIYIYNLPIEEVLFFLCIPYASLFTYHCLKLFTRKFSFSSKPVSVILIVISLLLALIFFQRLYTSVTSFALVVLLVYLTFIAKPLWLSNFYLCYLVILLPFFIVNGLLTGSWIDEPVVWYNNNENMGFRLLTIPAEDVFYGMLMLLLNTFLYERFSKPNES